MVIGFINLLQLVTTLYSSLFGSKFGVYYLLPNLIGIQRVVSKIKQADG
jgi:hypothetical protein